MTVIALRCPGAPRGSSEVNLPAQKSDVAPLLADLLLCILPTHTRKLKLHSFK